MSVATAPPPAAATARGAALLQLTVVELKLLIRERVRFLVGVGFPIVLLIIFGSIKSFKTPRPIYGGLSVIDEYMPILITFSLALLALGFVPMILAGYREKGVLRRLRTTPAGPIRVLVAQFAASLVAAAIRVVLILFVAKLAYNVVMPRQAGAFAVYTLLNALALLSIGLLIAAVAPTGQAGQTIGLALFFPLMFFAGLWLPIPSMPAVLQHISHGTPLGAGVTAVQDATNGQWPPLHILLILLAYIAGCSLVAMRLFRWE
jgi:ABC-2 type transport system permease protein